jgi:hypothetical protein
MALLDFAYHAPPRRKSTFDLGYLSAPGCWVIDSGDVVIRVENLFFFPGFDLQGLQGVDPLKPAAWDGSRMPGAP